jgi:Tfp pilus assembly protein PilN
MSVRVNLLPEETKQRGRASKQRMAAGGVVVLALLALGGVWFWAESQVRDAEDRLAAEQAVTAELRGEQAELVAFSELANRQDQANAVLAGSLANEVSIAGILQDLAAVMPDDAQFDSLTVTIDEPGDGTEQLIGSLNITGQSLTSHAPGVERILLSLDKVTTFGELFLNSSTLDTEASEPIATFSVDGGIRVEARTERYADGLPGELR